MTIYQDTAVNALVFQRCEDILNHGQRKPIHIGDHTTIRSGSILYEGVRIGHHCRIGHGCILRREAVLGDHVVLSHYVVVEYESELGNWVRISPHSHITSRMIIEDRAMLGASVVTVNDKYLIWNHKEKESKHIPPYIGFGARIGTGSTLCAGVKIGRLALVGSGSVVTKDVPPETIVYGNPARIQRKLDSGLLTPNGLED